VPLLKRSFELWRELERADVDSLAPDTLMSREPLLTMTGALMIGRPGSEVVAGTLEANRVHHLEHRVLRAEDVAREYPGAFALEGDEIAIWEKDAGYLVPEACVEAYLRCAERSGNATLVFADGMASFTSVDGRVTVTTNSGHVYQSKKVVLCVGAWAPEVLGREAMEAVPLSVVRKVLMWFEPTSPDAGGSEADAQPDSTSEAVSEDPAGAFHRSKFPVYIWDTGEDGAFYGFPRQARQAGCENEGCKVALHIMRQESKENRQYLCSPSTIERQVAPEEVMELRTVLRSRMPSLAQGRLLKTMTCMYTCTEDGHFWLDFHPLYGKDVVVASPCSGHGFKMAPVIGEIVKDLVASGTTAHDISMFASKRGLPTTMSGKNDARESDDKVLTSGHSN